VSTAVVPLSKPGGKKSAEERIAQLVQDVKKLEVKLETALRENEGLVDRLAVYEIAGIDVDEYKRLKAAESTRQSEEQAVWNKFLADCDALRSSSPEFAEALRRCADITPSWLREIVRMPNPAGFVLFLGGANQLLDYLREVKPEVAVKRIRQAGYDMHHKLPKFQGGN
jgi:hypothetical protein